MDLIDEKIEQAEKFYTSGNFVKSKQILNEIISGQSVTDEQKQRAIALQKKMTTDPAAIIGFGATLFVLLFLVIKYLL